jgi:hypothetical protein
MKQPIVIPRRQMRTNLTKVFVTTFHRWHKIMGRDKGDEQKMPEAPPEVQASSTLHSDHGQAMGLGSSG